MRTRSDNIRTSGGEHALLWIAPAVLAVFSTSALVAPGAIGGRVDPSALQEARKRVEQCHAIGAELADFERSGGLARIESLKRAESQSLPSSIAPFEVQAHVRLLARALGFELESVDLAAPRPPTHRIAAGGVAERPLVVRAHGRIERLPDFIASLRELGHPLAVNALEIGRAQRDDKRFHIRIELGLFQAAADAPVEGDVPLPNEQ